MKKVFISQPMKGLTDEEILANKELAIKKVKKIIGDDIQILDSFFSDYNPKNGSIPLKYLSKAIEILADADVVYFCPNWETARGCKIEHQCAVEYGIDRIYG